MVIWAVPEQKQTTQRNVATPRKKKKAQSPRVMFKLQLRKNAISGQENIVNSSGTVFTLLFLKEFAPIHNFLAFFLS